MNDVVRIHASKQPRRPHYIREWAASRELKQVDLAEAIGVDKSLVSRWFSGSTPSEEWQIKLSAFFHVDREALFRHPDDDWIARFFRNRSDEEVKRMKAMLEAAFPKDGTNN
jgi:transcriptional regulator with XRE-family HTH domain